MASRTQSDDAGMAADAGADAIGLNFWSRKSGVSWQPDIAREIVAALPAGVMKRGRVCQSWVAEEIAAIAKLTGLDWPSASRR